VHSQSPDDQAPIEYGLAVECGGDAAVLVAARHKCHDPDARKHPLIDEWFEEAARFMRGGHPNGSKKFRVLICATGLPQEALEEIRARAVNNADRLSRAIIIDPASASQFFERFGLSIVVEASNLSLESSKAAAQMTDDAP
jgi:hypothetical protein